MSNIDDQWLETIVKYKDGVFPGKGLLPGSCEVVVGIQRIGDSVAHASARAATLTYLLGQLGSEGPIAEPPAKPTLKPNTATPSVPLRARKKELRQIEHRKRMKNRK